MENIIVFINYSNQIPIVLGMFGKDNLEYISKFDAHTFDNTNTQIYYHPKLNSKIYFYREFSDFLNESDDFFNKFKNCLFFIENLNNRHNKTAIDRVNRIQHSKKVFIWHYAEVFEYGFIEKIKSIGYDFILSGSKRPEIENDTNFELDLLLPFRYFRYYIGYYYLEELISNIPIPKYDSNKSKIFSYIRANRDSSWRNGFIDNITGLSSLLHPKNSANDAYDLLYPKYKHFEAINDYLYCNFNLLFETIDYRNNIEYFITEKTFKGLFFGKPIILVASYPILNFLKEKGFYIGNFEFMTEINSIEDLTKSIQNFTNWINTASDIEIETKYNKMLELSINNRKVLFDYLNDYTQSETIFQKLLNN
jgi:hypothetical protein